MTLFGTQAPLAGPAVHGDVPGPRSAEMLRRQEQRESNARTYPRGLPIAIEEAAGPFVRDVDGNVFIDYLNGAGVLSLGHNHPELVAVMAEQMTRFIHGLDFPTPAKEAFVDAQLSMLPASMRDDVKMHFCGPTGANAVEAAIKLCKTATGRGDIVSFSGGYHGCSHAAMAVTGNVGMKEPIRNGVPGVHFLPFGGCARREPDNGVSDPGRYLDHVLRDANGGIARPAAVIMEMLQGEGGVLPATVEFAQQVRATTRELGIPLIVDEVQTGCGRTGTWFAFEQYGIEPDVIVASKALSGVGQPIAMIIYRRELDAWAPGAHTGTFRGNQLAFAAGAKAVEIVNRDGILANVVARGEQFLDLLEPLLDNPWVTDVRGRGLMLGVELTNPTNGLPAGDLAVAVRTHALRNGLIVELGGRDDRVVRMLPALNITEDVVATSCSILIEAITECSAAMGSGMVEKTVVRVGEN